MASSNSTLSFDPGKPSARSEGSPGTRRFARRRVHAPSSPRRTIKMRRAEIDAEVIDTAPMGLEGIEAQLDQVLQGLRRKIKGVRGSVVADSNGLVVASDIRAGVSPAILAAMSTLIAQSAGSVFENIEMEGPDSILMEGPKSNVIVKHIPVADVTLLALVEKTTNLGILKIEIDRAAEGVATALGFLAQTPARTGISELFDMTKGGILIRHYS